MCKSTCAVCRTNATRWRDFHGERIMAFEEIYSKSIPRHFTKNPESREYTTHGQWECFQPSEIIIPKTT